MHAERMARREEYRARWNAMSDEEKARLAAEQAARERAAMPSDEEQQRQAQAAAEGDGPFLWQKQDGVYRPWSWRRVATEAAHLARALRKLRHPSRCGELRQFLMG